MSDTSVYCYQRAEGWSRKACEENKDGRKQSQEKVVKLDALETKGRAGKYIENKTLTKEHLPMRRQTLAHVLPHGRRKPCRRDIRGLTCHTHLFLCPVAATGPSGQRDRSCMRARGLTCGYGLPATTHSLCLPCPLPKWTFTSCDAVMRCFCRWVRHTYYHRG